MSPETSHSSTPLGRPNPVFVLGLTGVAAVVLAVGAALRPGTPEAVTTAVPSNELATLAERSQRRALRDMAEYIRERAGTFAVSVVYLPEHEISAIAVDSSSVLTVLPAPARARGTASAPPRILRTELLPSDSSVRAAPILTTDTLSARWTLVVARTADGRILSLAGLTGGLLDASCGEHGFRELVFNAVVPQAFRGGGVFDLDGNAVAQVVPCGDRTLLVPLADILGALESEGTAEPLTP